MVDIATRVWNHKWKIDPIVRSLLGVDPATGTGCWGSVLANTDQNAAGVGPEKSYIIPRDAPATYQCSDKGS